MIGRYVVIRRARGVADRDVHVYGCPFEPLVGKAYPLKPCALLLLALGDTHGHRHSAYPPPCPPSNVPSFSFPFADQGVRVDQGKPSPGEATGGRERGAT